MIKRVAWRLCLALVALSFAGCATSPENTGPLTAHIAVLANGRISLGKSQVDIPHLGAKLKSLGIKPSTAIVVSVPKNVSQSTLAEVAKNLRSAGYQRVAFAKPVEVEASVSQKTTADGDSSTPPSKPAKSGSASPQKPLRSGTL